MHALRAGRAAELPTAAISSSSCFSLPTTLSGCATSDVCAVAAAWAVVGTAGRWAAAAAFAAARASGPSFSSARFGSSSRTKTGLPVLACAPTQQRQISQYC